jgi:hypothetical protein
MRKIILIAGLTTSLILSSCASTEYLPANNVIPSELQRALKDGYKDYTNCFNTGSFGLMCTKDNTVTGKMALADMGYCLAYAKKESYTVGVMVSTLIPFVGLVTSTQALNKGIRLTKECLANKGWYEVDRSSVTPQIENARNM